MPSGTQAPLSHTLLAGPNNSKPLSQEYDATVPSVKFACENTTVLCAGEPGKLHNGSEMKRNYKIN